MAPWSVLRPNGPALLSGSISGCGSGGSAGSCLPSAGCDELALDILILPKRVGVLSPLLLPFRLEETGVPPLDEPPALDALSPASLFLLTFSKPIDSLADVALVLALPKRDRREDNCGEIEFGMFGCAVGLDDR